MPSQESTAMSHEPHVQASNNQHSASRASHQQEVMHAVHKRPDPLGYSGKTVWGNAMVGNRTRKIRQSGMKWSTWLNVAYGGTVNPLCSERVKLVTLHLRAWRTSDLSRPQGFT